MKSLLSMAILSIFMSACISAQTENKSEEVPKYGILPFETENISPKTARLIPKKYNENLATTVKSSINNLKIDLDKKPLQVSLIQDEPISRTDVEMPVASFDDEYKNTLYTDLQDMSADYDGLIFGHLEEEFAGNGSLLLIMRVYKKDGDIESFEGEPIDLGVVKKKNQMRAQLGKRIIQLSEDVKRYIVKPPVSVGSAGDAPQDNEDNGAPDDSENDIESLLPAGVDSFLPSTEVDSTNKPKTTSMSLKEVYKMLYERGFYVIVPFHDNKHINSRKEAARELRINKWEFRDSFEKVKRKTIEIPTKNCYEKQVYLYPVGTTRKIYNICYDVRYLYSEYGVVPKKKLDILSCADAKGGIYLPKGRKTTRKLTYSQAEQEINRLRDETGNQRWRIPSIEELYVFANGHLPYPNSNNTWERDKVNLIWSSTSLPSLPDRKWVIQAYLEEKWFWTERKYKYIYRPKLGDSSNYALGYAFPVYTCGTIRD